MPTTTPTARRTPRFTGYLVPAILASLTLGSCGGEDLPFGLNSEDIVDVYTEDGHVYRSMRPVDWDFTYVRFAPATERAASWQRNEFVVVPFDRVIRVERPRQDGVGEPVPSSWPLVAPGSVPND